MTVKIDLKNGIIMTKILNYDMTLSWNFGLKKLKLWLKSHDYNIKSWNYDIINDKL